MNITLSRTHLLHQYELCLESPYSKFLSDSHHTASSSRSATIIPGSFSFDYRQESILALDVQPVIESLAKTIVRGYFRLEHRQ